MYIGGGDGGVRLGTRGGNLEGMAGDVPCVSGFCGDCCDGGAEATLRSSGNRKEIIVVEIETLVV